VKSKILTETVFCGINIVLQIHYITFDSVHLPESQYELRYSRHFSFNKENI